MSSDHGLGQGYEIAKKGERQIGDVVQVTRRLGRPGPFNIPAHSAKGSCGAWPGGPGGGSCRPSRLAIVPQPDDVQLMARAR